jgi:hypothetical protein
VRGEGEGEDYAASVERRWGGSTMMDKFRCFFFQGMISVESVSRSLLLLLDPLNPLD